MSLTAGTRIGPYEIQSPVGMGGMGEVYRARDTRLQRDVAIKVLPESVAQDEARLARFEREARTLAALNHPHIAQVHGFETADGLNALVMEFVEGPTLADRISQGPIPIDEAVSIARQIAQALEAAHDQGIVHRDLKPANVKVRADDTVKVLDFGLAKAIEPAAAAMPNATVSPTITTPAMTQAGMILGTAAYMSPEQAKGKSIDKRTDVWAFGCVLYEMLTGRRAFDGEDVTDVLVAVLSKEPDWAALPAVTPPAICRLLKRSLERDRRRRLADIADAHLELDDVSAAPAIEVPQEVPRVAIWRGAMLPAGVAVVAAAVAGSVGWSMRPSASRPVARFAIALPAGQEFTPAESTRNVVAVSPDGSRIAYMANGRLYLRTRDRLEAAALAAGRSPFFSPDGQWLGFWHEGQIRKVSVNGGAPIVVNATTMPLGGVSWGADDTILYGQGPGGIWRVSAAGGTPEHVVKVDAGQRAHGPQLLPGGRAVLFTLAVGADWDDAQIVVHSLDTGARRVVVQGGTDARYLPTGHLVYVRAGRLLAVPFDVGTMESFGAPVPLEDGVAQSFGGFTGTAQFGVSDDGTLVYVPASSLDLGAMSFVWLNRMGHEEEVSGAGGLFLAPSLSPDGRRVAFGRVMDDNIDVWTYEFRRGLFERLTEESGRDSDPIWSPDGLRIAYIAAGHEGGPGIFVRPADGTGEAERLTTGTHVPSAWSPDGERLVYSDFGSSIIAPTSPADLAVVYLKGERRTEKLLTTPQRENNAVIAPGGQWLAYESSETGEKEVYVRPFPDVSRARQRLSTAGGVSPVWAADGKTLFYRNGNAIMAVKVQGVLPADWERPEKLFDAPYFFVEGPSAFNVAPDGRFLMLKIDGTAAGLPSLHRLIVVQNWTEELARLVPTR